MNGSYPVDSAAMALGALGKMAVRRKVVLILQRRMTEYRVPFFDRLREELAQSDIETCVVYGSARNSESSRLDGGELGWGTRVKTLYLPMGRRYLAWLPIPKAILAQSSLTVVPHENGLLPALLPLLIRRNAGTRLAFWGHGPIRVSSPWLAPLRGLKAWSACKPDWWFAYTQLSMRRVEEVGFSSSRITCVDNAIDVKSLLHWKASLRTDEVSALRRQLGLEGRCVGVFLASLTKEKRPDTLLRIADTLRATLPSFELVIIGDGPMRGLVERESRRRSWVRWVGSRHGREKVLYASLGQLMLNPGMVGLSILDSFALGLPLLTAAGDFHSPEIAYLEHGRNGFMVANTLDALVEAAAAVLTNEELKARLSRACREDASKYSVERMAERFADGVVRAIDAPRGQRCIRSRSPVDRLRGHGTRRLQGHPGRGST